MSPAGDSVGKAARSGGRTLKRGASRAGHAGAQATSRLSGAAEQKLTERGLAPGQLVEAVAENAAVAREEALKGSRRARKKFEKNAKRTRKQLAKNAKKAGKKAEKQAKSKKIDAKKAGKKIRGKADRKAAKAEAKLQQKLDKKQRKQQRSRRKWPIVVGLGAAAAAVYVVRSKNAEAQFEQDTLGSRAQTPSGGAPEHNGQHAPESAPGARSTEHS